MAGKEGLVAVVPFVAGLVEGWTLSVMVIDQERGRNEKEEEIKGCFGSQL